MSYDCCFKNENNWFRYRTGGILIYDNKMLFVKSAVGDYYYMIGGNIDGLDCHTLEFYYYMRIMDKDLSVCKNKTDMGEELVWLPIEDIEKSSIKPSFISERINEIVNGKGTLHIIEERDR